MADLFAVAGPLTRHSGWMRGCLPRAQGESRSRLFRRKAGQAWHSASLCLSFGRQGASLVRGWLAF